MSWRDKGRLMARLSALAAALSLSLGKRELRALGAAGKRRKTLDSARERRKRIARRRRELGDISRRRNMRTRRGLRRAG